MDVLSDVMQVVRVSSSIFGRLDCGAPWGLRTEPRGRPAFYVILRGSCWLEAEGLPKPVLLGGGDFVFLPHDSAHSLRDSPETPTVLWEEQVGRVCRLDRTLRTFRIGGDGAPLSMIGGCFAFDNGRNALVENLPPVIHVRADAPGGSVRWLETTLQFVATEATSTRPGAELVANRLADILFVQGVRAYLESPEGAARSGWLGALADPQVGRALRLMHERSAEQWTVEQLAEQVDMSRSAFAARFRELVGDTPLNYLTKWRMCKAAAMLRDGATTLAVAHAVGYDSEAAFSKAFKRETGNTPGSQRANTSG